MSHLEEGTIQSYLHRELPQAERVVVERHASTCSSCSELIEAARLEDAWIRDRLASLDEAAPARRFRVPAASIPVTASRSLRRAAVILGAVIVGGTSVAWGLTAGRAFLRDTVGLGRPDENAAVTTPAGVDPASITAPEMSSGIAVEPSARFAITFDAGQDSGMLRVAIVETDKISVRASSAEVSFESRADGIVIHNRGVSGDYALSIPERAPFVEVRLANVVLFSRQNGIVRTIGTQNPPGGFRIPLAGITEKR
jgi:anti-sigma factor RsiW